MLHANPTREEHMSAADRRSHFRHTVLKRTRLFPVEDLVGLAVHNMSLHGLMGQSATKLLQLQRVHISFDDHRFVPGQVRWIEGESFGFSSEDSVTLPLDPFVVSGTNSPEDVNRREPRVAHHTEAVLAISGPVQGALVRNISDGGAQIQTPHHLQEGARILFQLSGRPALLSRVQWAEGDHAGLKFSDLAPSHYLRFQGSHSHEDMGTEEH